MPFTKRFLVINYLLFSLSKSLHMSFRMQANELGKVCKTSLYRNIEIGRLTAIFRIDHNMF